MNLLHPELKDLLDAAEGWDRSVLAALFFSGLRRAELARVRVDQIDQDGGLIRDVEGKNDRRDIIITAPLRVALDDLVAHAEDDHLIPGGTCLGPRKEGNRASTPEDRRCGTIHRAMVRIRKNVRGHLRPRLHAHAMRHSLKTFLADNAVPSHVRDALLGHRPQGVAGRYEHATIVTMRHHAKRVLDPLLPLIVGDDAADVGT